MNRFALLILPVALAACMPEAPDTGSDGGVAIPAAIQGRWGLAANECTADPSIAKGLLTIDATTLKFYESRGTLVEVKSASATRLEGTFDFTGEGQIWQLQQTLDVQDGGAVLIRREYGPDAAPGALRYVSCG
ncbi:MAG: hypothetical protein U1A24_20705 [Cypionkella sp.]|uniref:hypothetical protein n=1 Tax=Cypionkella sp. TaxID=2811411 RepID=UPI002AB9F179|nr:hypothetical protein [Cypionkella sp.]MDZ4312974.1 hypothetical protein [Cypionkella sp.]